MSDKVMGYDVGLWASSRDEVTRILRRAAKHRSTIPYSDVTKKLAVIEFAYDDRVFHAMLGDVSRNEHEHGRPLLSTVVVHKSGDMQPGPGFFELAKSLGHEFDDIEKFWIQELKRVWKYWSGREE